MDGHKTLKHLMDTLFATMDLKSWTIYENSNGTVCNLRFCETSPERDTNGQNSGNTVSFKRKSQGQIKRDQQRLQNFRRPTTRSQINVDNSNQDIENERQGETVMNSLGSPVPSLEVELPSALNPDASPFRVSGESPRTLSVGSATNDMAGVSIETVPAEHITMPSFGSSSEDIDDSGDSCVEDTVPYKLPDAFENFKFREHLELQHIQPDECKDIVCHACKNNLIRLASKPKKDFGLMYCHNCYSYICKICNDQHLHETICSFPILDDATGT